jgi:hypothetical protein
VAATRRPRVAPAVDASRREAMLEVGVWRFRFDAAFNHFVPGLILVYECLLAEYV